MKEEFADLVNDFQEESNDLLEAMEVSLFEIQDEGMNEDNINAVFRAAHTIKGAGGLFELDYLVSFTHVAENLLDEIRNNRIEMSDEIVDLYFVVKDQLQALVDFAVENEDAPDGEIKETSEELIEKLNFYLNGGVSLNDSDTNKTVELESVPEPIEPKPEPEIVPEPVVKIEVAQPTIVIKKPLTIAKKEIEYALSIEFLNLKIPNVNPSVHLKKLHDLGEVISIKTVTQAPDLLSFNPQDLSIKYNVVLKSTKLEDEINNIFIDIQDSCKITIQRLNEQDIIKSNNEKPIEVLKPIEEPKPDIVQPDVPKQTTKEPATKEPVKVNQAAVKKPKKSTKSNKVAKESEIKASSSIRVEAHKIDILINLIGEMVIANSNVVEQIAKTGEKHLMESVSVVSRMLEEIREASMQTRMVPIGETFSRFKRIVRDLSKELGKHIELEIFGADTELDKTVTEKISDPLIHLVRNSLDHGIEMPEVREANGKSVTGTITLKAFHEAGSIAIQIQDDGKGLDPNILKAKAIEKGLISEDDNLTEKESLNLIMMAGFSTAESISNISGRGVGMDVVKRNIEALRGTIDLDSRVGEGTTITIRLPLTLAIIDGFLTKVGETFYVVPLEMIVECIELTQTQMKEMNDNEYINLRGAILPLLDLRDYFDIDKGDSKRENIIIVRFAEQQVGLIVNELHGEFQTVIKPLGKIFRNVQGIGGATILGSGKVAMILDIPILMQSINRLGDKFMKDDYNE